MEHIIKLDDNNLLSKQLWMLKKLEQSFENVDMTKISATSKFTDNTWTFPCISEPDFKWEECFSADQYPLMLLCKLTLYYQITYLNKARTSVRYIKPFITYFSDILKEKKILTTNNDYSINGLDLLTSSDISLVVEQRITTNNNSFDGSALTLLSWLNTLPTALVKNAPIFTRKAELPWDGSYYNWLHDNIACLGHFKDSVSYPPIPFPIVSQILNSALPWIDTNRIEKLTEVFDLFRKELKGTKAVTYTKKFSQKLTKKLKNSYQDFFSDFFPMEFDDSQLISARWYRDLFFLIRSACCQIILLTTGLRNVDTRLLKVGCCAPSGRSELLYYLVTNIKKTKKKNLVLPVPEATYLAVKLLENIRIDTSSVFIFSSLNAQKNRSKGEEWGIADTKSIGAMIRRFFSHYKIPQLLNSELDIEASAHCFRATLAGWIGQNSYMAIIILKRLFGHSNALMPDAYLRNNPIIIKQRESLIKSNQLELAKEITKAISSSSLAGGKADVISSGYNNLKNTINEDLATTNSESQLETDLDLTLDEQFTQLLFERISSGQIYGMLTPLSVICMRKTSDTSESPCSHEKYRKLRADKNFSKALTEILGTLPDPVNCIGNKCKDSLIGSWSVPLYETYIFYIDYLKNVSNKKSDEDFYNEAYLFIKQYGDDIKKAFHEVYGDTISE